MRRAILSAALLASAAFSAGALPQIAWGQTGQPTGQEGEAPPTDKGLGLLSDLTKAFQATSERVSPGILRIGVEGIKVPSARRGTPAYAVRPTTPASGILLEGNYALTSWFHISGAKKITVEFPSGEKVVATPLGRYETLDLVLLELASVPEGAKALELRREAPLPGTLCMNVGRGPQGLTVNTGIVSAVDRFFGEALQIDAAVNYVNLGGAVVDLDGNVLGMLARLGERAGVNSGVGFAAPSDAIAKLLPQLKAGKVIAEPARAFVGVRFGKEHFDPPGVELAEVVKGHGAEKAGLKKGDVIERFNGKAVRDPLGLSNLIRGYTAGDTVLVDVRRKDKRVSFELTLGERPEE
ncbi:MAG: S1C family serine protease [Planctomycetota bacterium]